MVVRLIMCVAVIVRGLGRRRVRRIGGSGDLREIAAALGRPVDFAERHTGRCG